MVFLNNTKETIIADLVHSWRKKQKNKSVNEPSKKLTYSKENRKDIHKQAIDKINKNFKEGKLRTIEPTVVAQDTIRYAHGNTSLLEKGYS